MSSESLDLEFQQILDDYRQFLGYEENVIRGNDEFITDPKTLKLEHEFLGELKMYIDEGHTLNAISVLNLTDSFKILERKGTLSAERLYAFINFFSSVNSLRECFNNRLDLYHVSDLSLDLKDFRRFETTIQRAILPDFTISDDASSELASVRRKIKSERSSIDKVAYSMLNTYKDYLTGEGLGIKNGLPVLPVKNSYRAKVKGVVEEISNSGETYFIVPLEILDINNRIYALKEREKAEEEKVLKELSEELYKRLDELKQSYTIGKRLDGLIGAINYGNSYRGNIASISDSELVLEDVVHPLLEVKNVVSNTIKLTKSGQKIMVVTGPNAGGKTVLLKSVAISVIMNQHGLLVPTKGEARLPVFDRVIFVGGDSQSLSENLSTFSGHLQNLNKGLMKATPDSLILFDELGQGTAPLDGEALALAVLDHLEKVGPFAIVTSHFDKVKDRALNDSAILPSAMIFDEEKIEPTFKLRLNAVGKSYALDVAKRLGFLDSVVIDAVTYLKDFNDTPEKRTIEELTNSLNEARELEEKLKVKEAELERLVAKRKSAIDSLNAEKEALKQKADKNIEKLVEERLKALDEIWNPGQKVKSLPEMSRIKGELKKAANSNNYEVKTKNVDFEVGNYVKVKKANANGRITAKNGANYNVQCGGLSIKCIASELELLPDPNDQKPGKIKRQTASIDRFMAPKTGVGLECVLIGMRVDEALEKLAKYLDDCILMNYHQVRIVHGVGTGALRTACRNYLDKHKAVVSYRFGGEGEGGVGSTVVTLK